MPELPEVETIVRHLRPKIRGKRILNIEVRGKRVLRYHKSLADFRKSLAGKKILDVRRLGKNIIFQLHDGTSFAAHLMMTGQLLLNPKGEVGHERLRLKLSGGNFLIFNDVRQFGWCRVVSSSEKLVGPDAFSSSFGTFKLLLRSHRSALKPLLLNQKIISGIGNIYADEILWYAGLRPTRVVNSLNEGEIKKLYNAVHYVLALAIKKEGTSARDYRKPDGTEGGYYKIRKVYQRAGENCLRDGAIIQKIRLGSRSAHFCPQHQK